MSENNWHSLMRVKLYHELKDIIDQPEKHSSDEVNAAVDELKSRGLFDEKEKENDFIDTQTAGSNEKVYPPKPIIARSGQQPFFNSVISLVLFIALFYLVFGWELSFIFLLAGVILIHELGHLLAMRFFRFEDLSVFFVPLVGAMAMGVKEDVTQRQKAIIVLAGPLPGIAIGTVMYYFGLQNENELLRQAGNIFLLLNLFNLLPIVPLDGGKLIQTMFFQSNEIINAIFIWISIVLMSAYAFYTESLLLLLLPVLLYLQFSAGLTAAKVRKGLKAKGIDYEKSYEHLNDQEYWLIRDEIAIKIKSFAAMISPGLYQYSLIEGRVIKQVKAILKPKPIRDISVAGKIMLAILWLLSFIIPFLVLANSYTI